jgi:hypothetical protein
VVIDWSQFPARPVQAEDGTSAPRVTDLEAHSRLSSILDICAHEGRALNELNDPRLDATLHAIGTLRAEIIAALATIAPLASDN